MSQHTIHRPVSYSGLGLWTGKWSQIRFWPAPADTGLVFIKNGRAVRVSPAVCAPIKRGIGITGSSKILSAEHLLAALYGLEIDNLFIEVEGDEIPFGDGSARPFARLLKRAGIVRQSEPRNYYRLNRPLFLIEDNSLLTLLPHPLLRVLFFYLPDPGLRRVVKRWFTNLEINRESFLSRIASARTFGQFQDQKRLKRALPFRVISHSGFLYPRRPRSGDEFVAHKVLDLLGGLACLGRPLKAEVIAVGSGHREHLKLVRLLSRRRNGYCRDKENFTPPLPISVRRPDHFNN